MPTRSISSDSTKAEATSSDDINAERSVGGRAPGIVHDGHSDKDASRAVDTNPTISGKASSAKGKEMKAWMESDKDEAAIPENDMRLVMPALMLVLFLAALDQTIVCECSRSSLRRALTPLRLASLSHGATDDRRQASCDSLAIFLGRNIISAGQYDIATAVRSDDGYRR